MGVWVYCEINHHFEAALFHAGVSEVTGTCNSKWIKYPDSNRCVGAHPPTDPLQALGDLYLYPTLLLRVLYQR